MTTSLVTSGIQNSDDATFRAWAKQINDQFVAAGLVRTADTGQIDFATVLRPTAINTIAGFAMYRMPATDPLQATHPIFIRIGFGNGNPVGNPLLQLQVGSGSDGANGLTGVVFNQFIGRHSAPGTSAAYTSYAACVPALGYVSFVGWVGAVTAAPTSSFVFSVMRPCDDTGAPLGEAICVLWGNGTTIAMAVHSYINNAALVTTSKYFAMIPSSVAVSAVGTDITLYRWFCSTPRVRNLPAMVTYIDPEIAALGSFSATVLGAARTWMPLGTAVSGMSASSTASHVAAMVWE